MNSRQRSELRGELAQWALVLVLWVMVASLTTGALGLAIHLVTGENV
jgi:hypothetical protein